jgi:type VI protein secretion system component VasK
VDRLRSWGRKVRANPWLAVGVAAATLLVCAWIGWAIHVTSAHGAREGLGVLIVWPAILAVLALISIPFVWAFRLMRERSAGEPEADPQQDSAEADVTEPG